MYEDNHQTRSHGSISISQGRDIYIYISAMWEKLEKVKRKVALSGHQLS